MEDKNSKIERLAHINSAEAMVALGDELRDERKRIVGELVGEGVIVLQNEVSQGSFRFVDDADERLYQLSYNNF